MATMRLSIAGRIHSVTCQAGEEQHLARLGHMLDAAARKAGASAGLTETRALLFAGLLLADELAENLDRAPLSPPPPAANPEGGNHENGVEAAAKAIEHLTARIENIAQGLENQLNHP